MSRRQEERAQRVYEHWAPKLHRARGRERADLLWNFLRARVNDLPEPLREQAYEAIADELAMLTNDVTERKVRIRTSHSVRAVPEALRGQTRRAGARD